MDIPDASLTEDVMASPICTVLAMQTDITAAHMRAWAAAQTVVTAKVWETVLIPPAISAAAMRTAAAPAPAAV